MAALAGLFLLWVLRNAVVVILNSRGCFSWLQNRGLWASPWSENHLSIPKLCALERLDGLAVGLAGRAEKRIRSTYLSLT